mmetsp:Transcript_11418/g.10077  ORF Transcript_11418/g.10077 Transcript_11418/m.10077 type:complete len:131 (+) Transcript_11418:1-393(+)
MEPSGFTTDESLPNDSITYDDALDDIDNIENSDEDIYLSEIERIGADLSRRAQANEMEEIKERSTYIADWVRLGQRVGEDESINGYLSSTSRSESTIDYLHQDSLQENNEIFELKDVSSNSIKTLFECQI